MLRYWPKDAYRNKGDPWFSAVVTDYEEDTGAHIVTYQFGTQKEEKERVSLALKQPNELRVSCCAGNSICVSLYRRKQTSAASVISSTAVTGELLLLWWYLDSCSKLNQWYSVFW